MRLAKRLAFLGFDLIFGIVKGEQPLSRGSSASKSLVVFWFSFDIKREQSALMKKRSNPRTGARTCAKENLALRTSTLLYYTPNPPDFYDQFPKASIFRPSATLQGRASVLYFL